VSSEASGCEAQGSGATAAKSAAIDLDKLGPHGRLAACLAGTGRFNLGLLGEGETPLFDRKKLLQGPCQDVSRPLEMELLELTQILTLHLEEVVGQEEVEQVYPLGMLQKQEQLMDQMEEQDLMVVMVVDHLGQLIIG